jgi:hypothetical protein
LNNLPLSSKGKSKILRTSSKPQKTPKE